MPCMTDPDPEEERQGRKRSAARANWEKAYHEHHDEVETVLEKVLDGEMKHIDALKLLRTAKRKLADRYEEIYEGIKTPAEIRVERIKIFGKYV